MQHEFCAQIQRLEGKIKWTVVYVPFSIKDTYETMGRFPVQVQVDGHSFSSMLLPSKQGHYFVFNKEMKDACKKSLGDQVCVTLEPDSEPRTVEIPEYVSAMLATHPDLVAKFASQPDYLRREQINHIKSAAGDDTRERRLEKLLALLQKAIG